mgnify:CR=1 FL=1
MKIYALNEKQLKTLIIQANSFLALQTGEVDNWSYYYDSLDDAYTQWAEDLGIKTEAKDLDELEDLIAEEQLKEYPIIDWKLA